jgi:hypothetical protein
MNTIKELDAVALICALPEHRVGRGAISARKPADWFMRVSGLPAFRQIHSIERWMH